MRKLTPYFAFRIYFSIREHFQSTSYNIADYGWNFLRPMEEKFHKWHGYGVFKTLADHKIENVRQWVNICIVAFKENPAIDFRQLLDEFPHWAKKANDWTNHISIMKRTFLNEGTQTVRDLFSEGKTFDKYFPAWLLQRFLDRKMCVEVFIIFRKVLKIGLDGNPNYEYLYKDSYTKYEMLLNIAPDEYRDILTHIIKEEKLRRHVM